MSTKKKVAPEGATILLRENDVVLWIVLWKRMNNWFHSNVHEKYHPNQKSKREKHITSLSIRAVFVFELFDRVPGVCCERFRLYIHILCDDRHFFSPESKFISTQFTTPYGRCSGVKVPKLLCPSYCVQNLYTDRANPLLWKSDCF